jgi:hypothetical protein
MPRAVMTPVEKEFGADVVGDELHIDLHYDHPGLGRGGLWQAYQGEAVTPQHGPVRAGVDRKTAAAMPNQRPRGEIATVELRVTGYEMQLSSQRNAAGGWPSEG